ncbi:MAG: lipoate--protein ligase family protein [Burkholderiaceae bacterium]
MQFKILTFPADYRQSARFDESLISEAAHNGPIASVWQAEQGMVVPRTYQNHEGFDTACQTFAKQGWPITVRLSGGGIVPQGPGIINLSLAYAVDGPPLAHSDSAYQLICTIAQRALEEHHIATHTGAVSGSFCDGRYNLVHGNSEEEKKVAGTAQLWRRVKLADAVADVEGAQPAPITQIVLVHALILAVVDVQAVTQQANLFEKAIHHDKQYEPDRMASLHECQTPPAMSGADFTTALTRSLLAQLKR